jgi:hypothetical protein
MTLLMRALAPAVEGAGYGQFGLFAKPAMGQFTFYGPGYMGPSVAWDAAPTSQNSIVSQTFPRRDQEWQWRQYTH